ncbi:protein THYLAKOID ASSEMBLY 8-like, chloroplastic [Magnolia sinica]|uniref:protein THYLAKOID ASSEMBLY 8-like, chloroplastic n=1 Tax=Magnolia sinica TaxID=86752 RepID=UPI00265B2289|nr:protein THYLAKOID ASSEMBLY 8-like, chloroplastic [Magnolia sinica]
MHSSPIRVPYLYLLSSKPESKNIDFHGVGEIPELCQIGIPQKSQQQRFKRGILTMRDRSKNRKPLQRGRISIEAIQTVQALKRAKENHQSLNQVFELKVRRLIKPDIVAVLRELQRQKEGHLALQVFEGIRKEYWYKPQASVYADMIAVLASNGLFEKVELLLSYMKMEIVDADIEGFNAVLRTLMEFGISQTAMECFLLMKEVNCEPDEITFRILINGFESMGEVGLSAIVRQEAGKYFGGSMEFLEEKEETTSTH